MGGREIMIKCTIYNLKNMSPFSIKSFRKCPKKGKKIRIFGRLWKIITIFNDLTNLGQKYDIYVEET